MKVVAFIVSHTKKYRFSTSSLLLVASTPEALEVLAVIPPTKQVALLRATAVLNAWTLRAAFRAWRQRNEDLAIFRCVRV